MVMARDPQWPGWPSCPCHCGAQGLKLQTRYDRHLVGCVCYSCRGRRSQAKGRKAQGKMHRNLGGSGVSPANEESARPYEISVTIMPESKAGTQVPDLFAKFTRTEWFRRALSQSARAVPVGSGALPAVVIDGNFCIVDIRGRQVMLLHDRP